VEELDIILAAEADNLGVVRDFYNPHNKQGVKMVINIQSFFVPEVNISSSRGL